MELEEFSLGNSRIHDIDPRVKILVTLVFSFVTAVDQQLYSVLAGFALPITLLIAAGLSVKKVLIRLVIVNGFVVFIWLLGDEITLDA